MEDSWQVVHIADGEFDAQHVKLFLEAHGISCHLRGESLRKTHALTLDGLGAVRILVSLEKLAEARELLEKVQAGELMLDSSSGES